MRPHDVLGVAPGAPADEVRRAFRSYARTHHPDRGGDPERFQAGVEAAERLLGGAPGTGARGDVVFHRRPKGIEVLTARPRAWWRSRRRPPRVH